MKNANKVALIYDFDKTLSPKDMQEWGLFEKLNVTADEFYGLENEYAKNYNMDSVCFYMFRILQLCKRNKIKPTKQFFQSMGENIKYFNGVEEWFERINKFAKELGLKVEHYIISSGNYEILQGCSITKYFKKIFASSYIYEKDEAVWPSQLINYTAKTQYIFRIKKNLIIDLNEDKELNKKITNPNKLLPYENMVYLGDGHSDVPCMKLVKDKGGRSISVYDSQKANYKKKIALRLYKDGRVNFYCEADYSENSKLDKYIKKYLQELSKNYQCEQAQINEN